MLHLLWNLFLSMFQTRKNLLLENAMLRQRLVIYLRSVKRPKLMQRDRILLVWLSRVFSSWKKALLVVRPDTVIGWQRQGFKLYWKWKSRRVGRPCIDWPLIKLIRRIHKENLLPFVRDAVIPGAVVLTDGWGGYNDLPEYGYTHKKIASSEKFVGFNRFR